jgi:hypothetical protein
MLGEYVQDNNEKYATVNLGKRRQLSREKNVVEREVSVKVKDGDGDRPSEAISPLLRKYFVSRGDKEGDQLAHDW